MRLWFGVLLEKVQHVEHLCDLGTYPRQRRHFVCPSLILNPGEYDSTMFKGCCGWCTEAAQGFEDLSYQSKILFYCQWAENNNKLELTTGRIKLHSMLKCRHCQCSILQSWAARRNGKAVEAALPFFPSALDGTTVAQLTLLFRMIPVSQGRAHKHQKWNTCGQSNNQTSDFCLIPYNAPKVYVYCNLMFLLPCVVSLTPISLCFYATGNLL